MNAVCYYQLLKYHYLKLNTQYTLVKSIQTHEGLQINHVRKWDWQVQSFNRVSQLTVRNMQEIKWTLHTQLFFWLKKFLEYQRQCVWQRSWKLKKSVQGFEKINNLCFHYKDAPHYKSKKCVFYTGKYDIWMLIGFLALPIWLLSSWRAY